MNIEQSSKEQKLKALIEDMGVGDQRKAFKANLVMRSYSQLEGISYDEAITLIKEQNDILEQMSVFDPAWETICLQRNQMLRWAEALNNVKTMGRHDHEHPVHALVSVNGVTVETTFYIPQLLYTEDRRNIIIKETLLGIVNQSSEWHGGFRNPAKIDFVEL